MEDRNKQGQLASRINSLTREEIAQAMEQLTTDALEWAVRFEALAHSGDSGDGE